MNTTKVLLWAVPAGWAAVLACTSEPIDGRLQTAAPPPEGAQPVDVTVSGAGEGSIAPPPLAPEAPTRNRRRMDIDQLDRAIKQVTGGIGWTERRGNTEVNLFDSLSATLGKPDFIELVDEDLAPTAMFQKFLDDAARSVCDRLMAAEQERSEADRVFFTAASWTTRWTAEPDAVRDNLRYLLLRYHGRRLASDAPELEPWTWLMQSAEHVGAAPIEVWRTVCVGLITHPDFFTY